LDNGMGGRWRWFCIFCTFSVLLAFVVAFIGWLGLGDGYDGLWAMKSVFLSVVFAVWEYGKDGLRAYHVCLSVRLPVCVSLFFLPSNHLGSCLSHTCFWDRGGLWARLPGNLCGCGGVGRGRLSVGVGGVCLSAYA
jgi:hypothetical protein